MWKLRQIGTYGVQMKGALPWLAHWALLPGKIDFCPALAALVCPVQKIFFLAIHYFNSFVPIAQQVNRQSCRVACLWVYNELVKLDGVSRRGGCSIIGEYERL